MPDFRFSKENVTTPITHAFAVTPHDTNELTNQTRGIYVGVSGDVKVTTIDGDAVTFVGLASGVIHPIMAKIIWSTGTTATSIVGVY
jgi:hypothetical protein